MIRTVFDLMTPRRWAGFFAFSAAALLGTALISQYFFGFMPCKLCIYQRWPYGFVILFGLLGAVWPRGARVLLAVVALLFLGNAALGLFHLGVEYHWWIYASDCTATDIYKPGATVDEMMEALRKVPNVRCDERVPFLFGMTMAFYNMLAAFGLGVLSLVAVFYRSNSPSQYK